MDTSSIDDRKNIRDYYIGRINDKLDSMHDLGEIDLYLYFNTLKKLDKKIYNEVKHKMIRDVLALKLVVLKDKLKNKHSLDHLEYTCDYAIRLLEENSCNYKVLKEYSKMCRDNYNLVDEDMYLEYARYCENFNNMTNNLVNDIKYRPSNSSLIVTLMDFDNRELHIRANNKELVNKINTIVSNEKSKRLTK